MSKEVEKKIAEYRGKIDQIDKEIVINLNKRAELVHKIRLLKEKSGMSVFDPKREEEIFEKVTTYCRGPLYQQNIHDIYEKILQCMKSFE